MLFVLGAEQQRVYACFSVVDRKDMYILPDPDVCDAGSVVVHRVASVPFLKSARRVSVKCRTN